MKKTLFVCLLAQASVYGQSIANEWNKELPKWIQFTGDYRARVEGFSGGGFADNKDDIYWLNRFRLNLAIKPTDWLTFFAQGQDSRVWGKNQNPPVPPFQDTLDVRQAYLEIGGTEKKTFGLRAGRQEFVFGDQRLIGHLNWTNAARSFDGVRMTLRHNGYRLDAFASAVVVATDGQFDRRAKGNDFHGLYGGIEKLIPNAVIEPYALWRVAPAQALEVSGKASTDFKTYGFRWVGKIPAAGFDYGVEMPFQRGKIGSTDTISAWAAHYVAGQTLASLKWKPRVYGEYNFASGDKDPKDRAHGTFDQLYPTGHDKYGIADQVGWRNIHDLRAGVEFKPDAKWMVNGTYNNWWLAEAKDGLYTAAGALLLRNVAGTAGTHVGQELDGQATYSVTRQTQVGFGVGHLFPGQFIKSTTAGKSYTYPYVMLGYTF